MRIITPCYNKNTSQTKIKNLLKNKLSIHAPEAHQYNKS